MLPAFLFFLFYLFAGIIPYCALLYLVYWLFTLPMRRNERARLFLDLLQTGLEQGRAPEQTIIETAATGDRALGNRFRLLADYLAQGIRLSQALELLPRILPPQVQAMLAAGERIGDISKVLPASRQLLKDGASQVRAAISPMLLLAFFITPAIVAVQIRFRIWVLPAFLEVFAGAGEGRPLPAFTRFAVGLQESNWFITIQLGIVLLLWLAMLAYIGGPRFRTWLSQVLPGVPDRLFCWLPWRWKRLQRDFSTMLALLLDAQVPEVEAVALAAQCTGNSVFVRRAQKAVAKLNQGVKLPQAIAAIDDVGELRWRLSNALRRGSGFLKALAGWHEALDAKAFQLEQSAAQSATIAMILLNGLIVGTFVIGVFLALISVLNQAVLW